MNVGWAGVILMAIFAGQLAGAQAIPLAQVAPTPPMGWNSWDSYGLTITEQQFRANVKIEADRLKPFGYTYAVIDEGWFLKNPQDRPTPEKLQYAIDANGRYIPVPSRFPSSGTKDDATSFKALGDYVHSLGLKFGIHIVRGIPRISVEQNLPIAHSAFHAKEVADTSDACPWDPTNWGVQNNAAGQAWYDSLLAQYAGWGVDLLKVDCISSHPYKIDEIRMIGRAIDKTGRPIVLSLSPGPTSLDNAAEVAETASMWRISDDFWDYWASPNPGKDYPQSILGQFAKTAAWAQYARAGNWPDADMLPLGHIGPVPGEGKPRDTRLTPAEQQTLMTLWSMARSPLIVGANLTEMDDATLKLLTNRDVLSVDQMATHSGEVLHSGNIIAWTADLPANFPGGYSKALALFDVGEDVVTISTSFEAYGLEPDTYQVKDAWSGRSLGKLKSLEDISLEPHSSTLLLLKK